MRRRALLQSLAAGTAIGLAGTAHATAGRDPFAPTGVAPVDGCAEVVLDGDGETAFVAATTGFAAVDVSDPSEPTVLAEVRDVAADREDGPLESIRDVKLDEDRLLVSGPSGGSGELQGLVVYDVTDPGNPEPATEFHSTGFDVHNSDLAGGYAYLTNNRPLWPALTVVDVSTGDPEEVTRWSFGDYDPPGETGWRDLSGSPWPLHDVYVQDDYAYCAFWDAGTWILDVSDPTDPAFVSRVGPYSFEELVAQASQSGGGNLWELSTEAPGNHHYAAVDDAGDLLAVGGEGWDVEDTEPYGPAGITLYDVSDPANPSERSRIDPPRVENAGVKGTWVTAHNFDLWDGRLYSSWYQAGVKVHDVTDPTAPELVAEFSDPDRTAFWGTAAGEGSVVASSYDRDVDLLEAVFTFPDPGRASTTTSKKNRDGSGTSGDGDSEDGTPGDGSGGSADGSGTDPRGTPGFGFGAALGGLGLGIAAWWRRRGE